MHQYPILPIGTCIQFQDQCGYIIGNAHMRKNLYRRFPTDPAMIVYYLTYFPQTKMRRYMSAKIFKVICPPSDKTRTMALNYLPLVVNTQDVLSDQKVPPGNATYQLGDWVKTELFGTGLILSEGFYRPEKTNPMIYHHIYFPKTGVFEFERERYQSLVRTADEKSIQQAKEIIRDQIIKPAITFQ